MNVAIEGVARQSCPFDPTSPELNAAENGNDGVKSSCSSYSPNCSASSSLVRWWEVDLASKTMIHSIVAQTQLLTYFGGVSLQIFDGTQLQMDISIWDHIMSNPSYITGSATVVIPLPDPILGDRVRLTTSEKKSLILCEVEVKGIPVDECIQTSQSIDGISSNVLDGEDCILMTCYLSI